MNSGERMCRNVNRRLAAPGWRFEYPCRPANPLLTGPRLMLEKLASWRSGYVEDCKSSHPGSIPGEASKFPDIKAARRSEAAGMDIDFQAQRVKMVDGQLRTTDVTGHALLRAYLDVPRELFVPEDKRDLAHLDADIEITPGRFLGEASPIAKLMTLADISVADTVLNVGAGTGYEAAILSKLAGKVVALESDAALAGRAEENLRTLGAVNVTVAVGDLSAGCAKHGPYDVIIMSGSVAALPADFLTQLKDGGRLAVVEGGERLGEARLYVRNGNGVSSRFGFNAALKPLPGFAKAPVFAL
jgi:protein-L-isoaspartate(D-aspartate) O-methyltransferase